MTRPQRDPTCSGALVERLATHLARDRRLTAHAQALLQRGLQRPLADFLARPGKGLRGALVEHAYRLAGGDAACPQSIIDAVELLHAGSLIVDDIEDQSGTRRNAPALHERFGVPLALNAGNWLYFWAISQIQGVHSGLSPETELALSRAVTRTLLDSHQGQALDLSAHIADLPQREVPEVVRATTQLKTEPLIALSATLGATAAGANEEVVSALRAFGSQLGIALQMLDDSGGLHSTQRRTKGDEDLRLGRPTWPWAWLAEALPPRDYESLRALSGRVRAGKGTVARLREAICAWPCSAGRERAHQRIRMSFQSLRQTLPSADLSPLQRALARLEEGYG